ncbi:hypothetical protein UT300009_30790 [Paraclostridium bifermentans]
MPRPTKNVTALQSHMSKEEVQERLEKEKAITGSSDNIYVPDFIKDDEVAVKEYLRIVAELEKVDLITNVDIGMLGIYADSYSKYVESTMCMRNQPLVIEYTNKGGETNPVANPYIKVQQQYAEKMMKLSSSFGLDPASRSKIAHLQPSNKEEEEDSLKAMLRKLKENE